ncbi:MAG: hypothetical protein LAT64_01040 [Phycisphaerales bacterium]|nr:hypothetical protein [Planctomycetota bacterium]MCH8507347.1 hypothetical protein [Phycisphaerales bacterium]
MKLIAFLIITLSIIAGSLASSTAYLAPLDSTPRETLATLRLTSPAGAYDPDRADEAFLQRLGEVRALLDAERAVQANPLKPPAPVRTPAPVPAVETQPTGEQVLRARESTPSIGRPGDLLIPELIDLLAAANVRYVKVASFSFGRWPHGWLFILSCVGLLAGAWMVRLAQKRALAAADAAGTPAGEEATDAGSVFTRLSGRLHTLAEELAKARTEDEKLASIVQHIGEIQRNDVPAFVADRPALVNRLGLAGYAELMDRFAAMERQLNRAWSAAADGHLPESETCLRNAQPLLADTLRKLKPAR